jgi:hypothetical protein
MRTKPLMSWDKLSPKPVFSPPKKKARIHFIILDCDLEEDEKKTCSKEMGGGGNEKFEMTIQHVDFENQLNINIDEVIDNIQVDEPFKLVEHVASGTKVEVVVTKVFQPINPLNKANANPQTIID